MWAVARWADTYLLSEEDDLSPAMAQSFGAAGNGPSVLAALVQLAGVLLNSRSQLYSTLQQISFTFPLQFLVCFLISCTGCSS